MSWLHFGHWELEKESMRHCQWKWSPQERVTSSATVRCVASIEVSSSESELSLTSKTRGSWHFAQTDILFYGMPSHQKGTRRYSHGKLRVRLILQYSTLSISSHFLTGSDVGASKDSRMAARTPRVPKRDVRRHTIFSSSPYHSFPTFYHVS